ncbi:MAG: DPP IV N-terminal domain-containing protein [Bacteroidales bacterium]|nr:DPP IV N-terminal domain-containing protein [Bacteroidales bacterium]
MKKILLIALGLMIALASVNAQQTPVTEPNYELADQFSSKKVNNMVFSTFIRPNWFKNSNKFWYEWKTPQGQQYYIVDPVAKMKKPLFNMEKLAMELTEIVKDPFDAQHIPIRKLELKDDSKFTFEIQSTQMVEKKDKKKKEGDSTKVEKKAPAKKEKKVFKFEYDIATAKLTDVTENEEEKDYPRWANISPDGKVAVYAKNFNLYWMSIEDVKKLMEDEKDSTVVENRLTSDGTKNFYYGGSNYRGYNDSDSTKKEGIYAMWSPDSKYFAIPKYDMSMIKDLWVINSVSQPRPTLQTYKYQMPGEPSPKEYIYLFNMEEHTGKSIKIDAFKDQSIDIMMRPIKSRERYDDYMKMIWLGDNDKFYISRTSRDLKRIDICTVNVAEDSAKVVLEERSNTYIETRTMRLVNSGRELIQWSERNGWAHLYLYGSDGKLKNAITSGAFHVENVLEVDETNRVVYFLAMGVNKDESPYNGHVYRINFDGTGMKQLDDPNYNASITSFCDDGRFFVSTSSRVDAAPRVTLIDNTGRKLLDLEETDLSLLFAAGYKFPEPFKVKAADGVTDLYGVMYKPFDFDPNKKYPIIDYVYPGPQTEGNSIVWSKGFTRTDRLAQVGFIVITVGNRGGHPNRSKWYHNFGYGNLRDYGLEDQKYAIQQLASRYNFIDINRVGIHGHSGGGFMSTAAILSYPDFFKVAVSCAGNHDNSIYNRWWSEQHHGITEEVSAAGDTTFKYSIDKNQDIAKNLKGHLLLVHGDIDDNVHPGNTIKVVNALIRANKRFDMLILPGQRHSFGDMNEYFFWRMAEYYSEWLLGTSRRDQADIREMNND